MKTQAGDFGLEIEQKFLVVGPTVFNSVRQALQALGNYTLSPTVTKEQVDVYYDTPAWDLLNSGRVLRIRQTDGQLMLTIKSPTELEARHCLTPEESASLPMTTERFEYEQPVISLDMMDNQPFVTRYLADLVDQLQDLTPVLTVFNHRLVLELSQGSATFEVAFDDVTYRAGATSAKDYMVEIEVKTASTDDGNLTKLTAFLQRAIAELQSSTESKYQRGLRLCSVHQSL